MNDIENFFCTNCGYPLKDELLVKTFYKTMQQKKYALHKAANAVFVARNVLYVMAVCLLFVMLILILPVHIKYLIALIALMLSGLFFLLASWSRREPFPALFTAFIILVTFSAINIFNKLDVLFVTSQGFTSLLLCIALLFVMMKGLQGAYKLSVKNLLEAK